MYLDGVHNFLVILFQIFFTFVQTFWRQISFLALFNAVFSQKSSYLIKNVNFFILYLISSQKKKKKKNNKNYVHKTPQNCESGTILNDAWGNYFNIN